MGASGEWTELILRAGVPVTAALLGGLVGAATKRNTQNSLSPLVHFAAGAFLGIALLHLLPEAGHLAGWPLALMAAVLGFLVTTRMARWAGGSCPACESGHDPRLSLQLGTPLLAIVAVHSLLDGLALAGPDHAHHSAEVLSLAVLIHKLPEGLAIATLLRFSGASFLKSLCITAVVECCTFVGLLLGVGLGLVHGPWLGISLAVVAGSFVYLVSLTLQSVRGGQRPLWSATVALAGVFLIVAARLVIN